MQSVEHRTHQADRRRTVRRKASTLCKTISLVVALAGFAALAYYPTWKADSCVTHSASK